MRIVPHQKNIILTGYRASGKSLVGRLLAQELQLEFLDTDSIVSERLQGSIAEIVARQGGWQAFRNAERMLLTELAVREQVVIATGGGAILHQEAWQQLRQGGHVIWLDADPLTLCLRSQNDACSAAQRPPLTDGDINKTPLAEIEQALVKRNPLYAAGSDLRLESGGKDPAQVLTSLLQYLRQSAWPNFPADQVC